MNLSLSRRRACTHTRAHTNTQRVSLLMSTMLEYLFQSNSSPAAPHLSYFLMGKFKHSTLIVHPVLQPWTVWFQLKLLITEKAKHEGPLAAAVPISPLPQTPGLTHRPLCLLLSFGNSCAVITECVPRLNSCFLLLQRQSDTPSSETCRHSHTHMLAHMYIHSMHNLF